jgi:hypothetical protein
MQESEGNVIWSLFVIGLTFVSLCAEVMDGNLNLDLAIKFV